MTRNPVFITRRLPSPAIELLARHGVAFDYHDVEVTLATEALRDMAAGRSGIICQFGDRFDAQTIATIGPTCRVIATVSVGFDHVDVRAARQAGITVTHTPDVLTETTADLAWALMMATARRLCEAERDLRAGRWHGWGLMQYWGQDIHGATLGIIGGGRIGAAVARRAAGFNMRLLCATRSASPPREHGSSDGNDPDSRRMPAGTRMVGLETLLAESDFVSLHVPLTPQTRHLIGAAELARMKSTAILINASRGPVVDEAALVSALARRQIAAAGLDVYEHEPRVTPGLLALDNVVLLPHIGSASRATRETMATMAAQSVIDVLAGRPPQHEVPAPR